MSIAQFLRLLATEYAMNQNPASSSTASGHPPTPAPARSPAAIGRHPLVASASPETKSPRSRTSVAPPVASGRLGGSAVVEIDDVRLSFGENHVLRGVSLRIEHGETVAILGESGCGKTVLLKVMLGLLPPDEGRVRLFGEEVGGLSDEKLLPIRRRCSVVYQGGALFSGMTVRENIGLELEEVLKLDAAEVDRRVRESLAAVGLSDVGLDLSPDALSGGMKKRLAVARAIAPRPEMIVYDEPTSGLDPLNSARVLALIKDLHDRLHVTSVLVTHDVRGACAIAQRIVFLSEGNVAFDGTPSQFVSSSQSAVVAFRSSVAGFEAREGVVR